MSLKKLPADANNLTPQLEAQYLKLKHMGANLLEDAFDAQQPFLRRGRKERISDEDKEQLWAQVIDNNVDVQGGHGVPLSSE